MPRTLALIAVASALVSAALFHVVVDLALPSLSRALQRVPGYEGDPLAAGLIVRRPEIAVIGSSLAGQGGEVTFATELAKARGAPPGAVLDLAHPGRNVADLFAELVRAEGLGAPVAVVELNPFIVNDREHRLGDDRRDRLVVTEADRALLIYPHASSSVRLRLLRQLGLEGVLHELASLWSPFRLHAITWQGASSSSVAAGLFAPIKLALIGPPAAHRPVTRDAWAAICENFARKPLVGIDTDVLHDTFRYAATADLRATFVIPPMNRAALLARCGAATVANLDAIIAALAAQARQAGATLADLSHLFDGAPALFLDYGHYPQHLEPEAYRRWAGALRLAE